MGSLSAALLTINSFDGYDAGRVDLERRHRTNRTRVRKEDDNSKNGAIRRRDTLGFIEHITFTHHVSGTSLLVSWGLEEGSLDDFYTACCAGSFYSGVLTTVISSVLVRNKSYAYVAIGGISHHCSVCAFRMHGWQLPLL